MEKPVGKNVTVYNAKQVLDYIEKKYDYGYYDYVFHIIVNAMLAPIRGAITLCKSDISILEKSIMETNDQQVKTNLYILRDYIIAMYNEFNIDGETWLNNSLNEEIK